MTRLVLCAIAALAVYGMIEPVAAADLVLGVIDWLRARVRGM
jgi:hypothetical protein